MWCGLMMKADKYRNICSGGIDEATGRSCAIARCCGLVHDVQIANQSLNLAFSGTTLFSEMASPVSKTASELLVVTSRIGNCFSQSITT